MKSFVLMGVMVVLVFTHVVFAVEFNNGESHVIKDDSFSADIVYLDRNTPNNPGTHLDVIEDGKVFEFYTYNNSTLIMDGDQIMGINAYDNSTVKVTSGSVNNILAYDNSNITVSNLDWYWPFSAIRAYNFSTISFSGGHVREWFTANDNSTIIMSGGTIERSLSVFVNGTIYLKGEGFQVNGQALSNGDHLSDIGSYDGTRYSGTITGTLEDGTPLNNAFSIYKPDINAGTADIIILTCGYDLAGDTNNDCKVDREDFKVIADNWLTDSSTFTPEIVWAGQIGTVSSVSTSSVKLDDSGNVFICGSYSSGKYMFLAKHDSDGNLLWTELLGTGLSNNKASDVVIDTSGNSFICGYTKDSLYGANAGDYDGVIAKYNPAGILQWVRQIGSQEIDMFEAISVDETGNVYATGYTGGDIGGGNSGESDAFVSKYDTNGNLLWSKQLGSSAGDAAKHLKIAENGNIIIVGYSYGAIHGTNAVGRGVFTVEYDINGNLISVKQFPLAKNERIWDFEVDSTNNIYVAGYKRVNDDIDAILSKYTSNGDLLWSELLGVSSDDGSMVADEIWTVTLDAQENVFVGGYTNGDLGGINQGSHDVFAAKYDSEGNFIWVSQIGTHGPEKCYSIAVDESGSIYMTGWTDGNLGGASQGSFDAYLVKLDIHKYCDSFFDNDGNCVVDLIEFAAFATNWMVDCIADHGNAACVVK